MFFPSTTYPRRDDAFQCACARLLWITSQFLNAAFHKCSERLLRTATPIAGEPLPPRGFWRVKTLFRKSLDVRSYHRTGAESYYARSAVCKRLLTLFLHYFYRVQWRRHLLERVDTGEPELRLCPIGVT